MKYIRKRKQVDEASLSYNVDANSLYSSNEISEFESVKETLDVLDGCTITVNSTTNIIKNSDTISTFSYGSDISTLRVAGYYVESAAVKMLNDKFHPNKVDDNLNTMRFPDVVLNSIYIEVKSSYRGHLNSSLVTKQKLKEELDKIYDSSIGQITSKNFVNTPKEEIPHLKAIVALFDYNLSNNNIVIKNVTYLPFIELVSKVATTKSKTSNTLIGSKDYRLNSNQFNIIQKMNTLYNLL